MLHFTDKNICFWENNYFENMHYKIVIKLSLFISFCYLVEKMKTC